LAEYRTVVPSSSDTPLLSFIVLSYNYQDYIRRTIQSILTQTVQDFEIVVVDDASSDRSCEVVQGFNDPRIRLIVNERNLGGAGSYNIAVKSARGEWLVNLDADDWIAPEKCLKQLKAAQQNPRLDIIGTWVNVVGADGKPHPVASDVEKHINGEFPLNLIDTWIGQNPLCRSSTMVRRAAHLKIGLDDAGMVAAPDYELWTRAFAHGCRFEVLKERLTFMRTHSRGVTKADMVRSVFEICFALRKNLVPLMEQRGLWPSFALVLSWTATHPQISGIPARERERLIGLLMSGGPISTYADFRAALSKPDPMLEIIGRRSLFIFSQLELGRSQDMWSLSQAYEGMKAQLQQITEQRDRLNAQLQSLQDETGGQAQLPSELRSQPISQLPALLPGAKSGSMRRRIIRMIAPGTGRWVRAKTRLSRLEQRLLRFFNSSPP
jgi:GT2 family glycosyltransferase